MKDQNNSADGTVIFSKTSTTRQKIRKISIFLFMIIFPITFNYYSPILPIQGTLERVVAGSLIFWTAWLIVSLFIGRAACGYICPLGGLQEFWDMAASARLRRFKKLGIIKYVLFVAWIGAIIILSILKGGWEKVDPFFKTENYVSWDKPESAIIYLFMYGMVILVILFFGKRSFCHYLCWYSLLNILGSHIKRILRIPSLHLRSEKAQCIKCHSCEMACPMSLPVMAMVDQNKMFNSECILCGTCVDICRQKVISYQFGIDKN